MQRQNCEFQFGETVRSRRTWIRWLKVTVSKVIPSHNRATGVCLASPDKLGRPLFSLSDPHVQLYSLELGLGLHVVGCSDLTVVLYA
jgi:hypothetical protein